jgi:2-oxoglutarate ferredoxin oxidoreductase subunit beta
MNVAVPLEKPSAKDYASDQEVRWCPGCGDYAILKAVERTLADIRAAPEKTVFVSGIGCAARFPYYIATYGFHGIHGRAPAIATGIKLANPDLDVWVVCGDGDALSIGGNHLLHALRRNVDLQILLFNNEIYGLTKGQYSPTSRRGTRSPSTPMGSLEAPVSAVAFALGSGARFVARSVDTLQQHLPTVLKRAHAFRGAAFVEIYQNCIVYNDGVFGAFTERAVAPDAQVHVEHGRPLIFGRDSDKGLRLGPGGLELEVVRIGEDGVTEAEILVHDETNRALAGMLAAMEPPTHPVALGVLYCDPAPSYERQVAERVAEAVAGAAERGEQGDLNALLRRGHTWRVGD